MRKNRPEAVWKKITKGKAEECWPWTGYTDDKGYPRIRIGGKMEPAYRVVLLLAGIEIPPGWLVMHLCNNPICCNPAHLKAGTYAENSQHWALTKTGLTADRIKAIKSLYMVKGVTQQSLAELFGIDQTTVSKIIRGKLDHVGSL